MSWSDADVDQLTRLWKSGLSGAEIAKTMARSRSAVMGKLDRLGLFTTTPEQKAQRISAAMLIRRLKRRSFKVVPDGSS